MEYWTTRNKRTVNHVCYESSSICTSTLKNPDRKLNGDLEEFLCMVLPVPVQVFIVTSLLGGGGKANQALDTQIKSLGHAGGTTQLLYIDQRSPTT